MKKIFVAVVMSVLFVAQTALAMTFQQPIELGSFVKLIVGHNSFEIKGATYNSGQAKVDQRASRKPTYYTVGTARFGDGASAIWLHYNSEVRSVYSRLGGKELNNVLSDDFLDSLYTIFYLGGSDGFAFYAVRSEYDTPTGQTKCVYDVIGRKPDGTWVKYFNTNKFFNEYVGKDFNCSVQNVTASGNTLVLQYQVLEYKFNRVANGQRGEFRFTWDDAAKWFGVAHVVY